MARQEPQRKKRPRKAAAPSGEAKPDWKLLAEADDDTIDSAALEALDLFDVWERYYPKNLDYSFVHDVLEWCRSIDVDRVEWDGGAPGRSGVYHTVTTSDIDLSRREAKARMRALFKH